MENCQVLIHVAMALHLGSEEFLTFNPKEISLSRRVKIPL